MPKTSPSFQAGLDPHAMSKGEGVRSNGVAPSRPQREIVRLPILAYILGLVMLLVALTASGGLAYQHLSGHPLPGCGGGNVNTGETGVALGVEKHEPACATLEAHPMGSLGGLYLGAKSFLAHNVIDKITPLQAVWPVSLLGAAYFLSALAAWIVIGARGRKIPGIIVWIARLGAATSVFYLIVIVISRKFCPYCITSHCANLVFWLLLEIGIMKVRSLSPKSWRMDRAMGAVVAGIATFAICSGALGAMEWSRRAGLIDADEKAQAAAQRELEQRVRQAKDAADKAAAQPKQEQPPWGPPKGFRGRWLLGPKESVVRVVMLTDFQCPDCRTFEAQLMTAYEKNPDKISVSVVEFPFCSECNPYISKTMHENACWAARAAEAAAIVAGNKALMEGKDEDAAANEMFWKMAKWLFSVKGEFDEDTLKQVMPTMGITDLPTFLTVMKGPKTDQLVRADCKWGEVLGLFYTPMMFVNGVEVRGWLTNPQALTQAIDAVLKLNPPPSDARSDNPPLVGTKYFEDWKLAKRVTIQPGNAKYVMTTPNAKVDVVIFGDLTEPGTKLADEIVRSFVGKKGINYAFRHYPVCKDCNPGVDNKFPNGCLAAQAVEAAGVLGGPDAYFKMREFIFSRSGNIAPNLLGMQAGVLGLDSAKFDEALNSGPVKVAVQNDVMAGKGLVTRFIPTIYVDGKYVERWQREGDNVLERIIDYAVQHPGE